MRSSATLVERAFGLARSGRFRNVEGIVRQLGREGYVDAADELDRGLLRRQLTNEIKLANAPVSIEARLEAEARLAAGEARVDICRFVPTMLRLPARTGLEPV